MEPKDAREHLEMVDRILAHADRSLRPRGVLFVVWGLVAALFDFLWQFALSYPALYRPWWWALAAVVWAGAIIFTSLYARRCGQAGRFTVAELQFTRVLWITLACAIVVECGGWNIFEHWALAAIWTIMYAVPVLFIGVQGHRYAMAGGVVLLASIVVANFVPQGIGLVLGIGMIVGYAGLGVAFELER